MGKDFFMQHFQPRPCSGMKAAESDQVKGSSINVFIDLNSNPASDVIIIDEEEFVEENSQGPSVPRRDRKCSFQGLILIDDDDNDDDTTKAYHPRNIADCGDELDSDASSSERFSPTTGYLRNGVCMNVDDYHVNKEKASASNLPKNGITTPAEAAGRSCCGLNGFESGSSDTLSSDCEIMEVCEEWEKAWVKRKRVIYDQAGFDEQASSFQSAIYTDIGVANRTWQHAGSPSYSGLNNGKCVLESLSSFSDMGDCHINGINCNLGTENFCRGSNQKVEQERFIFSRFGSKEEMQSLHQNSDTQSSEDTGNSMFKKEKGGKESKYFDLNVEESEKREDDNGSTSKNKDDNISIAHSNYPSFNETHASHYRVVSQQSCDGCHNSGLGAEENIGEARVSNCSEVEVTTHSEVISVQRNTPCGNLQDKQDSSCLVECGKPSDAGDALHVADSVTNSDERDIINEREKIKETEEYKQAMEEEWTSRQRQLQIQGEEVQRLRKRKKAESMRSLDMQRRQKERVEEVRETQKKEEENMNIKEKLRDEITKRLSDLEMTCIDMASLLRCLGIQVGGGFFPLPHEVNAAYKRALLKFHPDRVSKCDIREQVEAEEKFKLISRMKDKLISTSCY